MAEDTDLRREVASYLTRHQWAPVASGNVGEMWRGGTDDDTWEVALPFVLKHGSREFAAIVAALKPALEVPEESLRHALMNEFRDTHYFRIDDRYVEDESIPLRSAAVVLAQSQRMVRAAATVARRARASIGSAYNADGDAIAARARFAHTERGSFLLPMVMPVEPVKTTDSGLIDEFFAHEPPERRVTRTLATALTTLANTAESDRNVSPETIERLVTSGVSAELVNAVRSILEKSDLDVFEARFEWAGAVKTPGGVPPSIEIGDERETRLLNIERALRETAPQPERAVTGPIVRVEHRPGADIGTITVAGAPNGRPADVVVTVLAEVAQEAHMWAHAGRAVMVTGRVARRLGGPLEILEPSHVGPLDELLKEV